MLEPEVRVVLAPHIIHREVGEEVFVLLRDSSMHWFKNPPAVSAFRLLLAAGPAGASATALAEAWVANYDVDASTAHSSATGFLDSLVDKGIARVRSGPSNVGGPD